MANEIEIRITGSNTANSAFEQVRRQVQQTGQAADEAGESTRRMGQDTDRAGGAFGRMGRMIAGAGEGLASIGSKAGEAAMSITGKGGPVAAFAMLGTVMTALPLAATAAGVGITLGVGGALAGIGLKAAAANVEVQAAFAAMKERVTSDLQDMAKPFESTLIRMSQIGEATFDDLSDSVRAAFARMAPQVSDFVQDAGEALGEFEPMIDRLSVAFGPLLATLGDRLPDITEHLADAFSKIGEAADPEALNMMIDGLNGIIAVSAEVIVFLERSAAAFAVVWNAAKDAGSAVKEAFTGDAGDAAAGFGEALAGVGAAALAAGNSVQELQDQISQLAGKELDAREAVRALEAAFDDASASVGKNGRTLDINTAKGRANQKSLDGIAKAALVMADKVEKSGGDSSKAMAEARSSFIRAAMGMRMSRGDAERLATKLGLVTTKAKGVPRTVSTAFKTPGVGAAIAASKNMASAVRSVPQTWDTYFRTHHIGDAIRASKEMAHGGIIGAAGGGPRSGMVLVGEQGPEIVKVAPGSTVIPAGQTRAMRTGIGHHDDFYDPLPLPPVHRPRPRNPGNLHPGGRIRPDRDPLVLQVNSSGSALDEALLHILRKAVRVRGGDVQVVLGR